MSAVVRPGPLHARITQKLTAALRPTALTLVDESHLHAGHAESPGLPETHFKLEVVSAAFEGQTLVQRHRRVYALLAEEMSDRVHALSLRTRTPAEAAP